MDRVHVEGLQKTKNDIIVPEVQKILEAQTFGEVYNTASSTVCHAHIHCKNIT